MGWMAPDWLAAWLFQRPGVNIFGDIGTLKKWGPTMPLKKLECRNNTDGGPPGTLMWKSIGDENFQGQTMLQSVLNNESGPPTYNKWFDHPGPLQNKFFTCGESNGCSNPITHPTNHSHFLNATIDPTDLADLSCTNRTIGYPTAEYTSANLAPWNVNPDGDGVFESQKCPISCNADAYPEPQISNAYGGQNHYFKCEKPAPLWPAASRMFYGTKLLPTDISCARNQPRNPSVWGLGGWYRPFVLPPGVTPKDYPTYVCLNKAAFLKILLNHWQKVVI